MAMALHATIKPIFLRGNNFLLVIARLTPSGNYAALGDVLELNTLARTSRKQPKFVIIQGESGYFYRYDLANKKIRIYVATSVGAGNLPLAEIATAALPAAVNSDIVTAFIIFA